MTVGEMLEKMTSYEFTLWMAYAKVEAEEMKRIREGKPSEAEKEAQQVVAEETLKGFLEKKGVKSKPVIKRNAP